MKILLYYLGWILVLPSLLIFLVHLIAVIRVSLRRGDGPDINWRQVLGPLYPLAAGAAFYTVSAFLP